MRKTPKKRLAGISLFLILGLLLAVPTAASANTWNSMSGDALICPFCGKMIPVESVFCMFCGHKYEAVLDSDGWGLWSKWSTEAVYASETREVETREVPVAYNMILYITQTDTEPFFRMFRNNSIINDLAGYHARVSYGEKSRTRTVAVSMLEDAVKVEPGSFVTGEYEGYQMGNTIAYMFEDEPYVWFIESTVTQTEYRFREKQ